MKIRKGDTVVITTGKSKGKSGKVLYALPQKDRVVVEGANIHKRHTRSPRRGEKGNIIEVPMPLHSSNVKVLCGECEKATRIGYARAGKNKERICKKCKKTIKFS